MIAAHQANIFPEQYFAATSSLKNGVIRYPSLDPAAPDNIRAWCRQLGIPLMQTVGLYVTYGEGRTYTDIVEVSKQLDERGASTKEGWVKADALITQEPNLAILLPVADCNAVVYVDPVQNVMALAHLGWHSTVQNLASKLVKYMSEQYGSAPSDILIYNSPSIRANSYRFTYLTQTSDTEWHADPYAKQQSDGTYAIDLVKYNYDQWCKAGILPEHIEITDVDTATSSDYPSHFAGQNSRFAVLAMMRS